MYEKESIEKFTEQLGSGEPTPGGGAAAALGSALGAALIMMVANHTIGKAQYAEFDELNRDVLAEAESLRVRLLEGMDRDAEAFGKVAESYALPKGSDARAEAIGRASVEAARAPLAVMEDSLAALRLARSMKGRSNSMLESDIIVAARSLHAGILSAEINVEANLPAIQRTDAALADELRSRAASILTEAEQLIAEIL
jgi:formiminotetrahydrofolate cyclodeaminase